MRPPPRPARSPPPATWSSSQPESPRSFLPCSSILPGFPGSRLPRPLIPFTMWFLEGERAVCGLSCRLVDVDHHTGTGGLDIGELESSRRAPRSEQALPAAQDDRIGP